MLDVDELDGSKFAASYGCMTLTAAVVSPVKLLLIRIFAQSDNSLGPAA